MAFQSLQDILSEYNPEALYADGFEDACIGFTTGPLNQVAIYDRARCIDILMGRDGMSHEEAEEFFCFNTECVYVGENGPLFVTLWLGGDWNPH